MTQPQTSSALEHPQDKRADAPSPDDYVSVAYLASRFSVHQITIWRWARAGSFPKPVNMAPKVTRWKMGDVLEWEAQQRGEAV